MNILLMNSCWFKDFFDQNLEFRIKLKRKKYKTNQTTRTHQRYSQMSGQITMLDPAAQGEC